MNMKNKCMIFLLGVIAGCSDQKSSIAGLYASSFQNENERETDTITITPLKGKANIYYFVHHIGIQKMLKGKFISDEHTTDSSLCIYNTDKKQITDQIYGKVYSVSDRELKFMSEEEGDVVYKRIQ
jgi:hypothetical protein